MPSVTIDAGVLAPPTEDGSAEDVRRYISTLLDWKKLLKASWVAVYMSARASDALSEDELYPLHKSLRNLFAANGIEEFAVNDVVTVAYALLQLTPSFEERFSISDVWTDGLLVDPDILGPSAGSALREDLARCLILIAILRRYCGDTIRDHFLILRDAPGPLVAVQAKIECVKHSRDDLNKLPIPPAMFEGAVLICDDFRGLIQCLNESSILVSSTDSLGLETAIRIALYKSRLGTDKDPDWDDPQALRIGHRFVNSVQESCKNQGDSFPARVLRAIVETLDEKNMTATHALRTGSGGGNPQRKRAADGAGAMRRDIDRDHHLHYWLCSDGVVELASVSYPHDNFSIPE